MPLLICEFYLHWTNHSYSCGQQLTAVPACSSTQLYCSAAENSADGQHWRPTRRHVSSYPKAKPKGLSDLPPFKAPNGGGMAHGGPLSTKGHCPTVILGQHYHHNSWRLPMSPMATGVAESSSSSRSSSNSGSESTHPLVSTPMSCHKGRHPVTCRCEG